MIFHIDMSNLYHQSYYSVIAMVSVDFKHNNDNNLQKGIVIYDPYRKELFKKYGAKKLHSSIICLLLEEYSTIEQVVICSDVKPTESIFPFIDLIRNDLRNKLISIDFLRKLIGIHNWKSQADAFANRISRHYPKQKNAHRKKDFFENVIILPENKGSVVKLENNLKKI